MGGTRNDRLRTAAARELRMLRAEQGLTQTQVAERCEFDRKTVSGVELGRSGMSFATFVQICGALDVDPAEVIRCVLDRVQGAEEPRHG